MIKESKLYPSNIIIDTKRPDYDLFTAIKKTEGVCSATGYGNRIIARTRGHREEVMTNIRNTIKEHNAAIKAARQNQ